LVFRSQKWKIKLQTDRHYTLFKFELNGFVFKNLYYFSFFKLVF